MSGMNWDEMTAEERLLAEQAVLNFRSLNQVARLAPDGHVLNVVERFAMGPASTRSMGRSIGSGKVEGACTVLIGRRLKANGARWRTRRVNRMAGLCSLACSDRWPTYWEFA